MKASLYDTLLAYANLIDHRAEEQESGEREREKEKEKRSSKFYTSE